MRGQSVLRWTEGQARQASKTAAAVLRPLDFAAWHSAGGIRASLTSYSCRARAAASAPLSRFASRRASGSAGLLQSRLRWRPWCGPTVQPPARCILPHSSARPDMKFGAERRSVHLRIRHLVFPDTAPARLTNVNPCDSPLHQEDTGLEGRIKPNCMFRARNRWRCAPTATDFLRSLKLIVYEEVRT